MAVAMWAKTAVGTNLAFMKGLGKAFKGWRDVFQQAVLRKVAPKPKTFDPSHANAKEKCAYAQVHHIKPRERLQTHVFRSLFTPRSRPTTRNLYNFASRVTRRRAAIGEMSGRDGTRNFRNVSLLSLIGVSLGLDLQELIEGNSEKMVSELRGMFEPYKWETEPLSVSPESLEDLDIIHESIASGCEGAVYKAKIKNNTENAVDVAQDKDFDLAVKAVFNYGADSNAGRILQELHRETVPLNSQGSENKQAEGVSIAVGRLPPHPNIVDMPGLFVDDMLVTEEGLKNFPAAMPRKLNPELCYGRNKTLYLVMRRRTTHLGDYLSSHDVSMATRCLILAQILEGVSHLVQHGIAHRDLKTNNILVDIPKAGGAPKVEICDFGCCLAEDSHSLRVGYPSRDFFMGGNIWLMAPEIATAQPGPNSTLDFSKTDVWAVGAIAYEIFGAENPFYPSKTENSRKQLSSANYSPEDLPDLPDNVPLPVRKLVKTLLTRDPKKRPSARVAAAAAHLVLTKDEGTNTVPKPAPLTKKPNRPQVVQAVKEREMLQKVLVQSLATVCQLTFSPGQSPWKVEDVARFLFLSRLNYHDFRSALRFF